MKTIRTKRSIIIDICWMSMLWIGVLGLSTTANAGLEGGLIAHYPLDASPVDVGPNGYDGSAVGDPAPIKDRFGNPDGAYYFDSGDYVETGKFQIPQTFSLSMWIYPKDIQNPQLFLVKESGGKSLIAAGFAANESGSNGYAVEIGDGQYAAGSVSEGWQHIAIVVEKSTAQYCKVLYYKNGMLLWSKNHFDLLEDSDMGPFLIGSFKEFPGAMDDVRIYSRALSLTEIELLYDPTQGLDITSDGDIDGNDLGFFAGSVGKLHWHKDADGDGYSDGTSAWGPEPPDNTYFPKDKLIAIFGDCDDNNKDVYPDGGRGCRPYGACCYLSEEDCPPTYHCDDNVSEPVCSNELDGTWHEKAECNGLTPDECPAGNEVGACCTASTSGYGDCSDDVLSSKCEGDDQTFYAGRICSDLSQEECPRPATTGSCCHPKISYVNESGVFPVQCLDSLTEYKCSLLQGTWSEGTNCEDLTDCPPFGACCYNDSATGDAKCANWMLEENCNKLSGTFHADEKCADVGCVPTPVTSACCLSENIPTSPVRCIDNRTETQCNSIGGTWYTPGEDETPVYCADLTLEQCPMISETTGACCITVASGTTTTATCHDDVTASSCADAGGTFYASRQCSDLSPEECPVPQTGSCCHPKISYVNESGVFPVQCLDNLTEYKCKILQGTWTFGEDCNELTDCPPYGACCYHDAASNTDKCANWMLEESCNKLSGSFHPNETCAQADCLLTPVTTSACCLSENNPTSPVRCIDNRTETQCNAIGGTWYTPDPANVDPTTGVPIPVYCTELTTAQCPLLTEATGACCVTLSTGGSTTATCNDGVTISNCTDAGGTFYAERQCSDLSASECPVAAPTGACCHPKISYVNESGVFPVQCLDSLTEYKCKLLQGTWTESTNCADLEDCAPYGACCYHDAASNTDKCANWMLEESCVKLSGSFHANETCADVGCVQPPVTSACCLSESGISSAVRCIDNRTETQCTSLGGTWFEPTDGETPIYCSELTDEQCPRPQLTGACCRTIVDDNGVTATSCADDVNSPDCSDSGGTFYFNRQCSDLSPEECPVTPATGSCCHPKISYVNESGVFPVQCLDSLTEYKCKLLQGTWTESLDCDELADCPPYGACCYNDGTQDKCANWMLEESCDKLSGTFYPNNTCAEAACVTPPITSACCLSESGISSAVRCIDNRTETQCTTLGGTWFEPTDGVTPISCSELSDEDCPPIPEITGACCIQTATTANCSDNVSISVCNNAGGTFFADRQCSDLSSEECPVSITGSCCHPKISYVNESGVFPVHCLDSLTEYKCNLLQGTWTQGDRCDNLTDCPPYGACCYDDADTGDAKCANWMLEESCGKLTNSVFHANETCVQADCVPIPVTSACCLTQDNPDATSSVRCIDNRTETQCNAIGGTWYEPEDGETPIPCSNLTEEQCPSEPMGACCVSTGTTSTCADGVSISACADAGGNFFSVRQCSDLTSEECPVPVTGSCCHPKISYVNEDGTFPVQCLDNLTEYKCKILQGTWTESGVCADLSETECAPYGACCYEDADGIAQCSDGIMAITCAKMGGIFSVDGRCSDISCGEILTPGACCLSGTGSDQQCMDETNVVECEALGGEFFPKTSCEKVIAYEQCAPIGACCYNTRLGYTCASYKTEEQCNKLSSLLGGTFHEGLSCEELPKDSPCYASGVCCLKTGCSSTLTTPLACEKGGGNWVPGGSCLNCLF